MATAPMGPRRHETRALLRAHLAAAANYRHTTRHCPICHRLLRLALESPPEPTEPSQPAGSAPHADPPVEHARPDDPAGAAGIAVERPAPAERAEPAEQAAPERAAPAQAAEPRGGAAEAAPVRATEGARSRSSAPEPPN